MERRPLQKLLPDPETLLQLLERWRAAATKAGKTIDRMALAYEAGRDGFWLARWLRSRGLECHVIHPTSVAVSREGRRAKTDRLDTALLMRAFLGWLRRDPEPCRMAAIPTLAEEDARRPNREHQHLMGERTRLINRLKATLARLGIRHFNPKLKRAIDRVAHLRTADGEPLPPHTLAEMRRDLERWQLVRAQIKGIETARLERLARAPDERANAMVALLARVRGVGIETADMLVREILGRDLRDRRAGARYAGLTGTPDESGSRRRDKGLLKAGNPRVRRGMVQLAWRWLMFQKESGLAAWYRARTEGAKGAVRKTLIVALARKLLSDRWRLARTGSVPPGVVMRAG